MGFKKHKRGEGKFNKQKKEPVHFDKTELKEDKIFFDDNSNVEKKWFNLYKDELNKESPQLPLDEVDKLKAEAQKFLENETTLYKSRTSKSSAKSEYGWIHTIMNKGTVSDRIAAHTIAIQDAPLYTLPLLKNLVSMAKVSKKNECITVLDTLTELFLSDLLSPKNKLRNFENCPLDLLDKLSSGNHQSRKSRLIHWYYEDQLKELYHTFVTSLHAAAQDTVERTKEKAISAMYKLLAGNPEHEAILLKNIINKLGDPSQKVASKAIYSLVQLLHVHPNMKFVVMEETEKLLFRPNVGHKAQYYGICFLSQFLLMVEDTELARGLIQIYFSFFKACVKKGEVDSRLMSALLIGVNRAYPFAKPDMDKMLDHIDTMYRVVHHANFNVSLHTLSLLFQVTDFANSVSDRFYSALYKKMLDPELATSSQQALFLSLVFKALKRDEDINRTKVFFKRLLQICAYAPVPLICGILYMVSQLSKNKETIIIALKMEAANMVEEEDGEEHYEDVKIEDMLTDVPQENGNETNAVEIDPPKPSIPTWYHCKNRVSGTVKRKNNKAVYDPLQRNPSFAGGEHCVYTELLKLSQHFHPTVTLFANNILRGEVIKYPGDPLLDFALPRFLDRFVFKNPKKDIKNDIIKQNKFSRKKSYFPSGIRSLCVNSASYLNEDDSRIPVDELFMYRYLKKKRGDHKGKVKEKEENDYDSDVSSVGSEDFNEILDRMMGGSKNDLDFAEDVAKSKSKKNKDSDDEDKMENEDDAEADGDESDDGEVDGDESEDDGSENDFIDEDLDDDAEDIIFDGSDSDIVLDEDDNVDDGDTFEGMPNEKRKNHKDRKGRKKFGKDDNVFVSAEEFSEMLDNMGTSSRKASGSSAFSTKDRAGAKQLKWETARDFWMKKEKKPGKNQNNKRKWNGRPGGKRDERNAKRQKKR